MIGDDLPRDTPCFTYGMPGSADFVTGARLAGLVGAPHHALPLTPGYIAERFHEMVELTDGMHLALNAHAAVLQASAHACDLIVLGNGGDCALDRLWWWNDADPDRDGFVRRMFERLNHGLSPALAPALLDGRAAARSTRGRAARGSPNGSPPTTATRRPTWPTPSTSASATGAGCSRACPRSRRTSSSVSPSTTTASSSWRWRCRRRCASAAGCTSS